jgi:RimJ/RimL family protein N-acetyltransferase
MQTISLGETNISGDRVDLRSVKQDDFQLLFRWLNDPEVYRWWGGSGSNRRRRNYEFRALTN